MKTWEMPPEPPPDVEAVRIADPNHPAYGQRWNRLFPPDDATELAAYLKLVWLVDVPTAVPPPQCLTWGDLLNYAGKLEACPPAGAPERQQ